MNLKTNLFMAVRAAKKAGDAVLKIYGLSHIGVSKKIDQTEVTEADLRAHEILLEELSSSGYSFYSEEQDYSSALDSSPTWVVDPLDGTKEFIQRTGEFAVMVGLMKDYRPVLGVVYAPIYGKIYAAAENEPAFIEIDSQKVKIRVTDAAELQDCRAVISRNHFSEKDRKFAEFIGIPSMTPKGSAGLKLGCIAEGNAEVYWNFDGLNVWDVCAPHVILEQAGGRITDQHGKPLIYTSPRLNNGILASNGAAHGALRQAAKHFMSQSLPPSSKNI